MSVPFTFLHSSVSLVPLHSKAILTRSPFSTPEKVYESEGRPLEERNCWSVREGSEER